jgi:DNA-binding CsgD family transcriptional regulator
MIESGNYAVSSIMEAERSALWSVEDFTGQMLLEREADAYLARAGAICSRRGARKRLYTDRQLANHRRRELTNYDEGLNLFAVAERELLEVIGRDIVRIFDRARLSSKQYSVWELFMTGMSQEEIARITKTTQSTVSRHFSAGKRKIIAALVSDPYYGWWEVYWSEVNRVGKVRK